MNLSRVAELVSNYARAELYALSSIRKMSDVHLIWGPIYARSALGIGAKDFSLYRLASTPKHAWSDYLINEPLKKKYAAITSKEARLIADDKSRFFEHCHAHGIRTIPILALVTNQPATGGLIPHLNSAEELARVLVPGDYFFKPSGGSHGNGTFSLRVEGSTLHWSGRSGSFDDFFRHCQAALQFTRALIVQPKMVNHQTIRNITQAKGLSTVRIVTVRKGSEIKVIGSCLRIIVGDGETDNFTHGSSGNLVGAIDSETGELIGVRASVSRTWPKMTDVLAHPRTGKTIVGIKLPYWQDVVELVSKAHQSIDSLYTVGWDVAITDNGPVIVEANWRYDIDILQVAYKKGYRQVIAENMRF